MPTVSEVLRQNAEALSQESIDLANSVDWEITKQAALSTLVANEVDEAQALEILDGLEAEAVPNKTEVLEKSAALKSQAEVFEKIASYIDQIESKLVDSEARVTELEKQASANPVLEGLIDKGFNASEVEELKSLSETTLTKVASGVDQTPWGLGEVSDRLNANADPLLTFLTN